MIAMGYKDTILTVQNNRCVSATRLQAAVGNDRCLVSLGVSTRNHGELYNDITIQLKCHPCRNGSAVCSSD